MSYTDFDISDMNVSYNAADDTYTVTVKVTNTGDMAGKKTVQVYVQSPYTDYDKETASRSLPFLWSASARPA